jgi:hypothetical protein
VIVKSGETVVPAGTVTDAGTAATAGLLLVSLTTAPPAGAGTLTVTRLLIAARPPATIAGESARRVKLNPGEITADRFCGGNGVPVVFVVLTSNGKDLPVVVDIPLIA